MNEGLEEIIKNIVYIDRGAAELKSRVDNDISEGRKHILDEIESLKLNIAEEERNRIKIFEEEELKRAAEGSEEILNEAKIRVDNISEIFEGRKKDIIKELFEEIIKIKKY